MSDLYLYLHIYLAVGVITLVLEFCASLRQWLRNRRDPENLMSLMGAQDPRSETLWYRVRARVLAPVLAAIATALLWPAVPWWYFDRWLQERQIARWKQAQIFKVQRKHLVHRLSIREIEERERIHDPMRAVPAVPFGHLNGVWRTLTADMEAGEELWYFSALAPMHGGERVQRTGYVRWLRGKSQGHIVSHRKVRREPSPHPCWRPHGRAGCEPPR
jgi:hypothetical protein